MSKRVLIVEDDGLLRWALQEALHHEGIETLVARDAREARGQLAAHPGLVLLDLNLPGADGWTLLRDLRDAEPALPVILMTASPSPQGERDAARLGAAAYQGKPFDLHEMVALVQKELSGEHAAPPGE